MATTETYEAEYRVLAGRPGMEALRRECPQIKGYINGHLHRKRNDDCFHCHGRDWVLLPTEERLGVLVRVAHDRKLVVTLSPADPSIPSWTAQLVPLNVWLRWGGGNYPVPEEQLIVGVGGHSAEVALTNALLKAIML